MFEALRVYKRRTGRLIDVIDNQRALRGYTIYSAGVDERGLYLVAEPIGQIAYLGDYCVHADGRVFNNRGIVTHIVYNSRVIPQDQFVLMAFGEWVDYTRKVWIKHLDGDPNNNALMNLKIMDGDRYDYNKQI